MGIPTATRVERQTHAILPWPAFGPLEATASIMQCRLGQTICFQDRQTDYWYRILSGAARQCALTAGGRRQVVDFNAIQRLQARTVMLGRNTALEKVSSFLLEMAERSVTCPGAPVHLPICPERGAFKSSTVTCCCNSAES